MSCDTCNVRDHIHAVLYCQECPDRPKPEIKEGRAYLYRKNVLLPVLSVDVEVPEGMECEASAMELMQQFSVEFVDTDCKELSEFIYKEMGS